MHKRFAICVGNADYRESLDLRKVYPILPDEGAEKDGLVRVVDESGEDYLYPCEYFVFIDIPEPAAQALEGAVGGGG